MKANFFYKRITWNGMKRCMAIRGSAEGVANAATGHDVIYDQVFMNEKMAVLYLRDSLSDNE